MRDNLVGPREDRRALSLTECLSGDNQLSGRMTNRTGYIHLRVEGSALYAMKLA
jgi:hypothetical protein